MLPCGLESSHSSPPFDMNFCSQCGAPLVHTIPDGDNRHRHCCPACGTIHYENPKMVVGCLAEWDDKILLCRRAIEPRHGFWTLPAGFMENGESAMEGALRETLEEAGARVQEPTLYSLISLPDINQVYLMFRAQLSDLDFAPGEESLEVQLFSESDVPWDALAFRTIRATLERYFDDRRRGEYPLHIEDIRHRNH